MYAIGHALYNAHRMGEDAYFLILASCATSPGRTRDGAEGGVPIVQRSSDGRGLYFPRIDVLRNITRANTRWGGGGAFSTTLRGWPRTLFSLSAQLCTL
jgi:hypothetical protein